MKIAIDPGLSGAIAWKYDDNPQIFVEKMPDNVVDMVRLFNRRIGATPECHAIIENVHSMPGMSSQSVFTFGRNFERPLAVLACRGVGVELVAPRKWMAMFTQKTKKEFKTATLWKKHLRDIAMRLYPSMEIDLQCADAILILHYFLKTQPQENNESTKQDNQ